VDARAGLDAVEKRKIPSPYRESNLGRPAGNLVTVLPELPDSRHIYILNIQAILCRSLSPQHGASLGSGWRKGFQIWLVAGNVFHKQSRTAREGW